jgi:hypothetical protein
VGLGDRAELEEQLSMIEVDFTADLWLFLSPWCDEKLENTDHADAIARAWVTLWNYTADHTSVTVRRLQRVCDGLFEIPIDELIDVLRKRRAVFFSEDNRLIEKYRVVHGIEDFTIFVMFAEPSC